MTALVASAPGKLVLTGEYAVLEGAPAVVLAVNRRARVSLRDSHDSDWHVAAPALGIADAQGSFDVAGRLCWRNLDDAQHVRFTLVTAVLEEAASNAPLTPCHADLDTQAFFASEPPGSKLGLGSSAALTVALSGAVQAREQRTTPDMETLQNVHRRVQQGRGSGLDIATSLHGGTLLYRLHEDRPVITPATWPAAVQLCCVWSGKSARTGSFLERLSAWRAREPAAYAAHMHELGVQAKLAANALAGSDVATLLQAMASYATLLDRLGNASGLDIVSAEHRAIGALAAACGVVYKTSGAGGGDVGIAVSDDGERLQEFRQRVCIAEFVPLDLAPDAQGLCVQSISNNERNNRWTSVA